MESNRTIISIECEPSIRMHKVKSLPNMKQESGSDRGKEKTMSFLSNFFNWFIDFSVGVGRQ